MKFYIYILFILVVNLSASAEILSIRIIDESCVNLIQHGENKDISHKIRSLYADQALKTLTSNNNNRRLSMTLLFRTANIYGDINEWKKYKKVIDIIKKRIVDESPIEQKAKLWEFYGFYYTNRSINDSAFYFYTKSEKIHQLKKNDSALCVVIRMKAMLQYYVGDYLGSEATLVRALRIARKINAREDESKIYNVLGVISNDLGQFDQSLAYHDKALKLVRKFKIKGIHEATSLNCIGYNYFCLNEFDKAIEYYNKALKMTSCIGDPYMYSKLLDNLAVSKFKLNQYTDVPNLYFTSANIRKSYRIEQAQNFNRLYLSEYYAAIKDTANAKKYADEAYAISENFKAPNDMLLCLKHLAKIDPKDALKYSSQYIKISDSMHQLERETRNKFAKIAYETEEIIQEKNTAEKQKTIFLGTTITVIAFGLLLLIIVGQRIRQKELLFAQSQQKAKEEIYQLIHVQQSKIDEGRQIEKKRIARDLHDGIMNKLASTRFNLHILNTKTDKETIKSCIAHIDGIHEIEKEIRNISHDLNKEVFSENDSFKRILVTFFEEQKKIMKAKLHTDIDKSIDWDSLKSSQKINLYRMLQEVFQNAGKHAKADHLFLSMSNQDNYILLEIHDDGIGFSVNDKNKGIGLQNLRARAKDCQGIFHINSTVGSGTTIIVSIPTSKENLA